MQYYGRSTYMRGYKSTAVRGMSAALSLVGGLIISLLLINTAETAISGWSPTETARQCFNFPSRPHIPTREDIGAFLLSAAFFGTDALYFDSGEENTGTGEDQGVIPSENTDGELPESPLGEGYMSPSDVHTLYEYDRSVLREGEFALLPYDLSGGAKYGEVLLSNTTSYTPDISAALSAEYPIEINLDEYDRNNPLILIIHTHGTEAYSPEQALTASKNDIQRSSDTSENMIAVGSLMAELLNDAGIPTVHCEIMHDLESYTRSYDLAADTIQNYLKKYPSIQYVFDVHRDAIIRSNGDMIRPVTMINGEVAAQIMLLVGTNEKGADHPGWMDNFTVAAKLQEKLTKSYDRFARPINIRGASFNEQFTPGSLLIEIGSAANSLTEAKTAAKYLTYAIIDTVKDNSK